MERQDISQHIDTWIQDLSKMDFNKISAQHSPNSWSLGQVCMHLIEATDFYMAHVRICLTTQDHKNEEMTSAAKGMFLNNDFPDEIIEGPPSNANTPQPENKEILIARLKKLKEEVLGCQSRLSKIQSSGKTKHPGLNYFSADEWYRFAEMHFRHHFRQKKRIESFLK
jgi:DinB family protein